MGNLLFTFNCCLPQCIQIKIIASGFMTVTYIFLKIVKQPNSSNPIAINIKLVFVITIKR